MITPGIGLVFWMTLTFGVLLFLLAKFAWKPILNALNQRETTIVDALNQAQVAREEIQTLKTENERIIKEAKLERDLIIKEAKEIKDRIVEEAKDIAKVEGDKIIEAAKRAIETERTAAVDEMKKQIGIFSVDIAEKILQQELNNIEAQNNFVSGILENKKPS